MLTRQKTVLSLLAQAARPLSPTVFVNLVFLLRQETVLQHDCSFYDFVPYNFGPFSFTLHWDLGKLRENGYVALNDGQIALCRRARTLVEETASEIPRSAVSAVAYILERYGRMTQAALIREVYRRYPWFALNSTLPERHAVPVQRPPSAPPAVYTAGYEGRSVDAFFNDLLVRGIQVLVDVRANPVSRKYGFSGLRLREFCKKLGLEYYHLPALGIPSQARAGLTDFASYQRLLKRYEEEMLPMRSVEAQDLGRLMRQRASVLVCVEKDVRCCHRSRLARTLAIATGMEEIHL